MLVDFCDSLRQTRCMKAVQVNDGVVSVENVSEPRGDGVIVDVRTVGICGSDLHLIDAGMMSVIPGHEIAGVTRDGTQIAIEPMLSCGHQPLSGLQKDSCQWVFQARADPRAPV